MYQYSCSYSCKIHTPTLGVARRPCWEARAFGPGSPGVRTPYSFLARPHVVRAELQGLAPTWRRFAMRCLWSAWVA
eukprot:COSAG05_NODE_2675_length_2779_cov_1.849254_1_plen_76_part_00